MVVGVLGFCGFDVVSTAAEEAHAPRTHLPRAIFITLIGMAVFWAAQFAGRLRSVSPSSGSSNTRARVCRQ